MIYFYVFICTILCICMEDSIWAYVGHVLKGLLFIWGLFLIKNIYDIYHNIFNNYQCSTIFKICENMC